MSAESVAVALIEAFNDNDWVRIASCCAPTVDYDEKSTHRRVHGAQALVEVARAWKGAFSNMRGTVMRSTADACTVVLEIVWTGTHDGPVELLGRTLPATGNAIQIESAFVVTVDGGTITHVRNHLDLWTLLTQVGALAVATVPGATP